MRIGFALEHLVPSYGGLEHWTLQCVRRLVELGHDVHVAATSFAESGVPSEARLHPYTAVRSPRQKALHAQRVLSRLDLDVVHDCGVGIECDVLQPHGGSRWAMIERTTPAGCRLVRRWLPRSRVLSSLQDSGLRNARCVIAVSRQVRDDLVRFHGVPPERIRVVYNGVNVERFSPSWARVYRDDIRRTLGLGRETLILTVAHNPWLKGVPTLLRSFARLRSSGSAVHLAVVGGKPRRLRRVRRWAESIGVREGVSFVGTVPDVLPWYGAADLCVHPTLYDPCSLVTLEALACGLPVITTSRNGVSELMRDGREGFVLQDPWDVTALQAAVRALLDESLRHEMGCAARALALRCNLDQNVRRVVDIYDEVGVADSLHSTGASPIAECLECCAA